MLPRSGATQQVSGLRRDVLRLSYSGLVLNCMGISMLLNNCAALWQWFQPLILARHKQHNDTYNDESDSCRNQEYAHTYINTTLTRRILRDMCV